MHFLKLHKLGIVSTTKTGGDKAFQIRDFHGFSAY